MKKRIIGILLATCFITMPIIANAEFDYSELDEMSEDELNDLKDEIMTRLGIKFDYSELDEMSKKELEELQDEIATRLDSDDKTEDMELTVDNYKDYIAVRIDVQNNSDGAQKVINELGELFEDKIKSNSYVANCYNTVHVSARVTGVSTNYNYNNVKLSIHFNGNYSDVHCKEGEKIVRTDDNEMEMDIEIDTNISGNGGMDLDYDLPENHYTQDKFIDCDWQITEISGTITPIR